MKKLLIIILILNLKTACVPPQHLQAQKYQYKDPERKELVRTAERYIGAKYKYGGTNLFGFDCSGFVMHVYKKNGHNLPRTARAQYKAGEKIKISHIKPGDLVFFIIEGKEISHVGIYANNHKFIHSPSKGKKVTYASLNNPYWKKRFAGAATYLKK